MHTGEIDSELATLCGCFYKIQGYLAAGTRWICGSVNYRTDRTPILVRGRARQAQRTLAYRGRLGAGIVTFVWLLTRRHFFASTTATVKHHWPPTWLPSSMRGLTTVLPRLCESHQATCSLASATCRRVGDCSAGCGSSSAFWNQLSGNRQMLRFIRPYGGPPVQQRRQTGSAAEGLIGVQQRQ